MTPDNLQSIAVTLCNGSRHHSGGEGQHDADHFGPCSQHEHDAATVARLIADAHAEGLARATVAMEVGHDCIDEDDCSCFRSCQSALAGLIDAPRMKPCDDANSNVCVAEGCFGEACVKGES